MSDAEQNLNGNDASKKATTATTGRGSSVGALVIDDEPAMCLFFEEILSDLGFQVTSAGTFAEGLAAIKRGKYDLVLADKNLPDGNGLELAHIILDGGTDTEVVIMSAHATLTSAVEAMQARVADYFIKPVDMDDAIARIKRVIRLLELKRENHELLQKLLHTNRDLAAMAVRDPLTGVFNHRYFQDSLDAESKRCERFGLDVALILFGVDDFKEINNTHGHHVGDAVLRALGGIMQGDPIAQQVGFSLRAQDIVSRYGGDTFAVILPETDKRGAAVKADHLRRALLAIPFEQHKLPRVNFSIGLAAFPEDAKDRFALCTAAEGAFFAAKEGGKNRTVSYTVAIGEKHVARVEEAEREARRATALEESIRDESFVYFYQPIVEPHTEKHFAYEALCRPQHKDFGNPLELIGTAERQGRIIELGRVLRQISVQGIPKMPDDALLFINLHPHEVVDPTLAVGEGLLLEHAHRVVFEITETAEIRDFKRTRGILKGLQDQGFRIALDDLGAGYASLQSLANLEPDFVKLDREFLQGIEADNRSSRLLRHILEFAKDEGMEVIAEGIETANDRDKVRDLGCTYIQGYFYGKPKPL
jgi:diguanylate cyclase (GGDEF)-like protein